MLARCLGRRALFVVLWSPTICACGAVETTVAADGEAEDAAADGPADREPDETGETDGDDAPPCVCVDDAECDDGDPCNGTERCRACACLPGPTAADGTACNDGDACTTGDACAAGVCSGVSRDCDDGNPCTDDACAAATGCRHAANTAACDDGDACTAPDVCSGGACVAGPRLPDWYPDADGDTFGDRDATPICAAIAPAGRVADHTDCCDSNASVFPGQTAWFIDSHLCAGGGAASWDYNCNGVEELRHTTSGGGCTRSGSSCVAVLGWTGSITRACGSGGSFVTSCDADCRPVQEWTAQECH